jgi:hypothetical protein
MFLIFALLIWLRSLEILRMPFIPVWRKSILISLGIISIVAGILNYHEIFNTDEGIVFTVCDLRQGPSVQSPHQRILYPGEKVRIKDHITGWSKVNLLNLDEGWVKNECLTWIDVREREYPVRRN